MGLIVDNWWDQEKFLKAREDAINKVKADIFQGIVNEIKSDYSKISHAKDIDLGNGLIFQFALDVFKSPLRIGFFEYDLYYNEQDISDHFVSCSALERELTEYFQLLKEQIYDKSGN